ncbi:MAG TPA: hypothetical protein DIW43_05795 [Spongiibacteraceae bacterium]|nr:hypothetical protein [Spongiibacteraceae bacterium]HCS26944.1 hypothetical protein [Spongiibacteraceae bacterium]
MVDDDRLVLAAEPKVKTEDKSDARWKVFIVDDEDEVHSITRLALGEFRFAGRALEFVSAYSAAEAQAVIMQHPDIAIILLDVVMESDDAGLQFAQFVRQTLGNQFVRIILRTGQPGMAPERHVMKVYDINDYRAKTELTQDRLYTVIQTALASYRDMAALARTRRQLVGIVDELNILSQIGSDQVRQPMRDVVTAVQALCSELKAVLSPEQQRMLESVKAMTTDIYLRVDDLVRLTESGSFNDPRSLVDLNSLLDDVRVSLKSEIDSSAARIDSDGLPTVAGSRRQLFQLLQNLLSNAIQFQSDNAPQIRLSADRQGDYWCFSIDDNGSGIPVEERQSVFSLFRRSGHKPMAVGSGIGLNICRKIVRWHGGEIQVEDSPLGGARITFTLPVTDS